MFKKKYLLIPILTFVDLFLLDQIGYFIRYKSDIYVFIGILLFIVYLYFNLCAIYILFKKEYKK